MAELFHLPSLLIIKQDCEHNTPIVSHATISSACTSDQFKDCLRCFL